MWDDSGSSHSAGEGDSRDAREIFAEMHHMSEHVSHITEHEDNPRKLWLIQVEDEPIGEEALKQETGKDDVPANFAIDKIGRVGSVSLSCGAEEEVMPGAVQVTPTDERHRPPIPDPSIPARRGKYVAEAPATVHSSGKGKERERRSASGGSFASISETVRALFDPAKEQDQSDLTHRANPRTRSRHWSYLNNEELVKKRGQFGSESCTEEPRIGHGEARGCDLCVKVPSLPESSASFKVVRSECLHFVAVSYCRPYQYSGSENAIRSTYQYRRVLDDGSSVMCEQTPPDEIMDRAIAFARACDVRQIWIDKICASGDTRTEGCQSFLQAKSSIFERAYASVALLDSLLLEQRLLNSLNRMLLLQRGLGLPRDATRFCQDLLDFFRLLA